MSLLTDEDRAELVVQWTRAKEGDRRAVEWLVERYHWLPCKIARSKRVPPHFDRDDVASWANAGLFDAVRKFDPSSGDGQLHEHFIGYATLRINGAILDGMKAPGQSWAPREVWRRVRQMSDAETAVGQRLGRPATRVEIAAHMGVAVSDLPVLQQQVVLDPPRAGGETTPSAIETLSDVVTTEATVEIADISERLAAKLAALSPAAADMAAELFFHGRDVRHIVEATGAPLARVRRQRAEMLLELRVLLQQA